MWSLPSRDLVRWLAALGASVLAAGVCGVAASAGAALPAVEREAPAHASAVPDAELGPLTAYRAALEGFLPLYQRDALRASERAEAETAVDADGAGDEEAWRALAHARSALADLEARRREADHLLADAVARHTPVAVAMVAPAVVAPPLVASRWALTQAARLQRFFARRFGRALPISALGQTARHDELGFDHRNALDIAVHPDSPEGRALIRYLRRAGVPWLAFRGPVPGIATGAHIHVGAPSLPLQASR
jgi:hypothetical protein